LAPSWLPNTDIDIRRSTIDNLLMTQECQFDQQMKQ
jgi:hypothetical protein